MKFGFLFTSRSPLNCSANDTFQIAWSSSHIAFTTDSGNIGVVDAGTGSVSLMKRRHQNIAGSVLFIPNRPREFVSGGYDLCLNHHDRTTCSAIASFDFGSLPPRETNDPHVSMSPPFILSMAISSSGVLAVGTADGRLWLGFGGEIPKDSSSINAKTKRRRHWEGLKRKGASLTLSIASGPVVGVAFESTDVVTAVTLGGVLSKYRFSKGTDGRRDSTEIWRDTTSSILKVNAISEHSTLGTNWMAVCGVGSDGGGVVELRKKLLEHQR
ncbi:uncharacterized protein EI90DRAFT_3051598 [Cantharellus anzutake]|uniref:uncharacterized protein n=1 Tax=Cantharellus anzutake TaxID=1750568 RepID=UPI001908FBBA|nr:uncharacterized protein EI90DRAFT_3051598 [Cantharellus anzutake]KAF8334259.1 hypothetical protein EI90DRAFT_3051598 [Cantharellus anzutake]